MKTITRIETLTKVPAVQLDSIVNARIAEIEDDEITVTNITYFPCSTGGNTYHVLPTCFMVIIEWKTIDK